ncbi:MAG TPA: HD domain-containing protein [Longimicrobiales bacterium]|nr:HD domain-containing protein [Longimicrobiales bacterium]
MTEPTKIIRDPLWNTIRLSPVALAIVDTPAFQRLRYIRQLGFGHLVYPGATHTRFDHALGVYHLTRTALRRLRETSMAPEEAWRGAELIPYAALLHDIGHYAYSHALEELEADRVPADHEEVSGHFFQLAPMQEALAPLGAGAVERLHDLIRGRSDLPLRGLVSGSLDLDKMEYLRRDAHFCGVPFGDVDVDRLLTGLRLLQDPDTGAWEIGVHEKAIAALESLLFAKYQMFRNVYWHHAVRSATALYKRIVDDAVASGIIDPDELVGPTDEELLYEIARRALEMDSPVADRLSSRWIPALRNRRLPKRALELTAADLEGASLADWILGEDATERRRVEDELALGLGLHPGEVMVDFPVKSRMFSLDVLVRRRNGSVQRLGSEGLPGVLDLPRVSEELYRTARVLRVYTFERRDVDPDYWTDRLLVSD